MLAEIYNWFTEGFDTADLKDAKALLDELSAIELMLLRKCGTDNPADACFLRTSAERKLELLCRGVQGGS